MVTVDSTASPVRLKRRGRGSAHRPVFRTLKVCIASGHFSIRPEAAVTKKEVTHA